MFYQPFLGVNLFSVSNLQRKIAVILIPTNLGELKILHLILWTTS